MPAAGRILDACTPSNADHDCDDDLYATDGDPDDDVADEFDHHFDERSTPEMTIKTIPVDPGLGNGK